MYFYPSFFHVLLVGALWDACLAGLPRRAERFERALGSAGRRSTNLGLGPLTLAHVSQQRRERKRENVQGEKEKEKCNVRCAARRRSTP